MASEKVLAFTDANFETEVLQSDKPVLVDFWAVWCAPCRAVAPIIDEMASDYDGTIKVGKVNVDENQVIPGKYGIRGIPTVILFNNGKVVDQIVGAAPKTAFKQMIDRAVAH
ncbi:MAG: thioredoxin [Deltaproteobacteria bacterium]|jgi:thioredoxin 1|nr:thioredoxin [Deltaproteobacteria bacterium]MCL5879483.1 thioredoxin [Deltaproteobacteria bacterium]MDA8304520.1 thioredoxin [Deltaproteobacteria bacterium]